MGLLKVISKKLIMEDVIRSTVTDRKPGEIYWRILILDRFASKVVSSSCKMRDITAEGVTLVEDLHKRREPLPFLEAIYVLKPSDPSSISSLLGDLNADPHPYKAFHIFFVEACPAGVFEEFSNVKHISRIKTLREINMSFIPHESHVFLMDLNPDTLRLYYNQTGQLEEITRNLTAISGQIATLCACLDEYPSVRYRNVYTRNAELAAIVEQKLMEYKQMEPKMGDGPDKVKSQLIILDRGFDCMSPLLHELTFEAMLHDLLPVENGAYKLKESGGGEKTVFLDADNESWQNLKHLHIAEVSQKVSEEYKKFIESKNADSKGDQKQLSARDLQMMVKRMPQYKKEMTMFQTQMSMAADCLKVYKRIEKLCSVEQDLANGTDAEGDKIKDHMAKLHPILLEVDTENGIIKKEKLRLIMLYILSKNGIPEESFSKLFTHANIDDMMNVANNLSLLGPNVVVPLGVKPLDVSKFERKVRDGRHTKYTMSRWVPVLKDIIEFAMEDRLDRNFFPFESNRNSESESGGRVAPASTRYGHWASYPKGGTSARVLPRIIIFVVGGISLSEIRSVYEINKAQTDWEVVIGSTEVLTPELFLNNLENLASPAVVA